MTGKQIADLVYEWAVKQNMHPDDFAMLFANELLEQMEEDN